MLVSMSLLDEYKTAHNAPTECQGDTWPRIEFECPSCLVLLQHRVAITAAAEDDDATTTTLSYFFLTWSLDPNDDELADDQQHE